MIISKYYSTDDPDNWSDGAEFTTFQEAQNHAIKHKNVVVEAEFEFSDSKMVSDYR